MLGLNKLWKRKPELDAVDEPDATRVDAAPAVAVESLRAQVQEALCQVYDPEIPVNIYDLGLIYRLDVDGQGRVDIDMTLTAPACPVAGTMPGLVAEAVKTVDGVSDARVTLVWDPPWSQDRMSEEALLQLGLL